jgi:3-hydroxyisobutyrate dehydrogenase-like beta-hydroxyacid dehydrogenase
MHDQLAFVGLGAMGHWAALNLARRLDEEGKVSCVWVLGSGRMLTGDYGSRR